MIQIPTKSRLPASHIGFKLGDQLFNDLGWLNAGQSLVETLVLEGESLMIDSQQVQDRGVEVADVDRILNDVVGEVVRLSVNGPALGTTARHPHRKAAGMVVTAVIVF